MTFKQRILIRIAVLVGVLLMIYAADKMLSAKRLESAIQMVASVPVTVSTLYDLPMHSPAEESVWNTSEDESIRHSLGSSFDEFIQEVYRFASDDGRISEEDDSTENKKYFAINYHAEADSETFSEPRPDTIVFFPQPDLSLTLCVRFYPSGPLRYYAILHKGGYFGPEIEWSENGTIIKDVFRSRPFYENTDNYFLSEPEF